MKAPEPGRRALTDDLEPEPSRRTRTPSLVASPPGAQSHPKFNELTHIVYEGS